jgi:hypothetical protein
MCCRHSDVESYKYYFEEDKEFQTYEPLTPTLPSNEKLYMAGKIIHLAKLKSIYPKCGRKRGIYAAYWSVPEDFQSILISNLMLQDHFPDKLSDVIDEIIANNKKEEKRCLEKLQEENGSIVDIGDPASPLTACESVA